jgi:GNAT superfamily N-acetyltransferase
MTTPDRPRAAAAGKVVLATRHNTTPIQVRVLGQVIADAFAGLDQSLWLVPDPKTRPAVLSAYFALHVELGLQTGAVYTNSAWDAVAVWIPVSGAIPTLPGFHARVARVTKRWTDRFRTFEAAQERRHPMYHPHHWLAFLAVHPSRQHTGVGTQFLTHHHRVLDQLGMPGYLQAASPATVDFYRAQGWRAHADPFRVAGNGPLMHPMWRQPGPPPAAGTDQATNTSHGPGGPGPTAPIRSSQARLLHPAAGDTPAFSGGSGGGRR